MERFRSPATIPAQLAETGLRGRGRRVTLRHLDLLMGGSEPFLGPLALFGGVGLATGVLVTAGVTFFVFHDAPSTDIRAATPTPRVAGLTLLREFGGPVGTPTLQPGVVAAPQESATRPPLGSALAALSEQETAQRPPAAEAPVAQPAPAAPRSEPARPAPAPQLAPYSAPATYFEPPPVPRSTETPRPTEVPRPTPTPEDLRAVREPGPVSAPTVSNPTPSRPTPAVAAPTARPTPPVISAAITTPTASTSTGGGSLPITAVVITPTRTTR